jgi:RNA polymerase sigma-70 factor (ECF subfamily)
LDKKNDLGKTNQSGFPIDSQAFHDPDEERPVSEPLPPEWESLFDAARSGSPEALGVLLEAARPFLFVLARRRARRAVRAKIGESDLVQETLTTACREFHEFRGSPDQLAAWLRRILENLSSNEWRYFKQIKRDVGRECPLTGPHSPGVSEPADARAESPSEAVIRKEIREAVRRALQRLPEAYRQVLELYYRDGKSFEEIAGQLGLSVAAVRKRWLRGLPMWRAAAELELKSP